MAPQHQQPCPNCTQPYTPRQRNGVTIPICAACEEYFLAQGLLEPPREAASGARSAFKSIVGHGKDIRARGFRPLSALPPDRRLAVSSISTPHAAPTRKDEPAKTQESNPLPDSAVLTPDFTRDVRPAASEQAVLSGLPVPPPAASAEPKPRMLPAETPQRPTVQPPASLERKIGFNCPACLAILIIKKPENYNGHAAPCPNCGTVILPPRVATPSPFTLMTPAPAQASIGARQDKVMVRLMGLVPQPHSPEPRTSNAEATSQDQPSRSAILSPASLARAAMF